MKTSQSSFALWLVLFVVFLDWIGIGLVYPMFSSMLFHPESLLIHPDTSQAVRGWYLGILLAAMPIMQFFSGPLLGSLSDQKGRKPLFLFSLALAVGGYLVATLAVYVKSIILLITSRCILGIAAGNAAVVSATIGELGDGKTKTKNFGLYSMACGVGFTIGPFLGGQFSQISYTLPFLLASIGTCLNLIFIYFYLQETNLHTKIVKIRLLDGFRNIKKAIHMRGLRTLFVGVACFSFGWSFFYEFVPVSWIASYGTSSSKIGLFYAYGALFYALSSGLFIRPIINRYKHPTILFYSLCFLGLIILALLFQVHENWVWIYLPLINFFVSLFFPTSTSMVSDFASNDNQGEVLGIFQSVQSIAWAISPLAAGPLLGHSPYMPMLLGGSCMLMAAMILGTLLKKDIFSKTS